MQVVRLGNFVATAKTPNDVSLTKCKGLCNGGENGLGIPVESVGTKYMCTGGGSFFF